MKKLIKVEEFGTIKAIEIYEVVARLDDGSKEIHARYLKEEDAIEEAQLVSRTIGIYKDVWVKKQHVYC